MKKARKQKQHFLLPTIVQQRQQQKISIETHFLLLVSFVLFLSTPFQRRRRRRLGRSNVSQDPESGPNGPSRPIMTGLLIRIVVQLQQSLFLQFADPRSVRY